MRIQLQSAAQSDSVDVEAFPETPVESAFAGHLQIEFGSHLKYEDSFVASLELTRSVSDPVWSGQIALSDFGVARNVYVSSLRGNLDGDPFGNAAPQMTDFSVSSNSRTLVESDASLIWLSGADAASAVAQILSDREAELGAELREPGYTGHSLYSCIMLADSLLLTQASRVPGIIIAPVAESTFGTDVIVILNDVLPRLGYPIRLDPVGESKQFSNGHLVYIHAPVVTASSWDSAAGLFMRESRKLLDLMSLKRHARGMPLGGIVIGPEDADGARGTRALRAHGAYLGNMAGGFISGEDSHSLNRDWVSMGGDLRSQLWLSMYADSVGEDRADYRFFRKFNLLEAIAGEVIPEKTKVTDESGKQLFQPAMQAGKSPAKYEMKHARAKIWMLAKRVGAQTNTSIGSWASQIYPAQANGMAKPGDLWVETALWTSIRNEVAHNGTFRRLAGVPKASRSKLEAEIAQRGYPNGDLSQGFVAMEHSLAALCDAVLMAALTKSL